MGKLHTIGKITIRVYANDHLPPHFHIVATEWDVLVEIATMAVLAGSLPRAGRPAFGWATDNKAAIIAEWNRINPKFPV